MAVIEMFVADEDVVIHRLDFFQIVTKEVRIKSKVDIIQHDVERSTTPPPQKSIFHLLSPVVAYPIIVYS